MDRSVPEVCDAALALSAHDRAKLAEKLVERLDGDASADAEEAWAAELERRLAKIDAVASGRPRTMSRKLVVDEAAAEEPRRRCGVSYVDGETVQRCFL